jgi:hypothetical protein
MASMHDVIDVVPGRPPLVAFVFTDRSFRPPFKTLTKLSQNVMPKYDQWLWQTLLQRQIETRIPAAACIQRCPWFDYFVWSSDRAAQTDEASERTLSTAASVKRIRVRSEHAAVVHSLFNLLGAIYYKQRYICQVNRMQQPFSSSVC